MVWFFTVLTGVFVYLLLPGSAWVRLMVAVAVTVGLYAFAYRLNGPGEGPRRRRR